MTLLRIFAAASPYSIAIRRSFPLPGRFVSALIPCGTDIPYSGALYPASGDAKVSPHRLKLENPPLCVS
jgi:hypothetical protein